MSDFFQIKVTDEARNALDDESKEFLADLGWYEEDMSRWCIVDAMTAEDYFDLGADEITAALSPAYDAKPGWEFKPIMFFDEVGESKESLVVEFNVREVPPLKSFSPVGGVVLGDDILFQMEREMRFLAEEAIPPGGGTACNWLREQIATPFDHGKYWDEQEGII